MVFQRHHTSAEHSTHDSDMPECVKMLNYGIDK